MSRKKGNWSRDNRVDNIDAASPVDKVFWLRTKSQHLMLSET